MEQKTRILMIEDETSIMELNKKHLEGQGYEVLGAGTLAEARNILMELPVDLILLDVLLPDGNGFDFCTEIHEMTDVPIIFLTCLGENESIVEGLLRGGDDYIAKPCDMDVLSVRIVAALRRLNKHRAGRVEIAPLSINLANDQVLLYDRAILLSRKEVQLLAFLASHPGREFTPAELYEAVWGMPSNKATRTVTVHVSLLRKKLGKDFDKAFSISCTAEKKYVFLRCLYMP